MFRRGYFVAGAVALIMLAGLGAGWLLIQDDETRTVVIPDTGRPAPSEPRAVPERADRLVAALNRAAQGDLDGARMDIDALHQEQPNAPGPYLGLAEIALRKGDLEGAETWLTKGLAVAPTVGELHRARARLFVLQKKDDEAVVTYEKAITLAPGDLRTRIELANLYATRLNNPEKAVEHFQGAVAADPGNAIARFGLGVVLSRLKRMDEARTALTEAQTLAPDNPMPSFTLGQVHAQEGRYADALAAFDAALSIQPKLVLARIARGDLLQGTRKYDEAIAEYGKALEIDPKSVRALLGLGATQDAADRKTDAETSYKAVLALEPNQPLALNNLAWLASTQNGNLDEALGWAKKAVALADGQAAFHDTLGWVYYQRREFTQASEALERAVQLQPAAVTYAHLGTVRAALGQKAAAAEAFRKALAIAPTYKPALDGLQALQ